MSHWRQPENPNYDHYAKPVEFELYTVDGVEFKNKTQPLRFPHEPIAIKSTEPKTVWSFSIFGYKITCTK